MKTSTPFTRRSLRLGGGMLAVALAAGSYFTYFSSPTPSDGEQAQLDMLAQYEGLTYDEVQEMAKQDRPDLAMLQNLEMTKDPNLGYVPDGAGLRAYRTVQKRASEFQAQAIPGVSWTERGPNDIGGRTRALMWDPNTANKVWAGGVSGGLWYNNNIQSASTVWQAVDNFWSNIAVTAIDHDPTNTNTFYVGTGEGYFNGGAVQGAGLWKTTDGGNTWNQLSSTNNSNFFFVSDVRVTNTGAVIVTTRTGLYRSTNGGASWSTVISGARFSDIEIASNGHVWATEGIFTTGKVWKSTNDGVSFSDVTPATGGERIELAIAPSDPNVVYASASNGSNIAWMYRTSNGGSSWSSISIPTYLNQNCTNSTQDYTRGQAWYDNILAVDPSNPNEIVAGGISHHKSTNGGSSWSGITYWTGGCEPYVHADQHAIATNPNNPAQAIMGSDGGVSLSTNFWSSNSPSFNDRNNGYNVTQFYSADSRNVSGDNYILTGAQDNGSLRLTSAGIGGSTEATGGDGAFSHIDQTNANYQVTAYVYTSYYRSTNNGSSFSNWISNQSYGRFINPTDYDDNSDRMYCAANADQYIYSDPASGSNPGWSLASVSFGGGQVSAVTTSPNTNNRVFFGIDNGRVYRVDNAQNGSSSTVTLISSGLPNGYISNVAVGSSDNELLVVYTNYGVNSVWYTSNGGSSWTSKEGNLPDMPVRWALFNPNNSNEVLLATEQGVWSTDNLSAGSVNWGITNTGLANVRTDMLQYRDSDGQVTVATYGRGAFVGFPFNGTPPPTCDVPTGLASSSVTSSSFTASWSAVSGATSYDLDVDGTVYNTTGTSFNVTGLSASTTYSVSVRANCSSGSSAYSSSINVTTSGGGGGGPSCSTTISSFPYNEGFESGLGAFTQATGDDLNWTRDSGGTPSSATGPSSGNSGSTWYMYVEASSPNFGGKDAILESPCFDLSGQSAASLSFAYHSYGTVADVNLTVEATTDGSTWSSIFTVTGNQGNQWNNASVDLSAYLGSTVKFRFVGTTGASWQGDVAIDDVSVSNSAAAVTLYSQGWESGGMGDWTNNTGDDFNWTARSGGTPSNNTGPSGAVEGSFYNYTEVSGANYPSKVAIMTSPAISLAGQSEAGLTFSYHMYGASNMGGLVLEASSNGSSWSNVWSRSGNQGNQWFTSDVDLSAYAGGNVYLRFVGTSGSTWQGD
ncbi:MAG TPA: hypothetical protein DCE41_00450, partial [Cytophagales bacterium]|nr:hypothetical protein [Cytophagales bacterium]